MDENHHYDLAIRKIENGYEVIKRLNIGDIKSEDEEINLGIAKTRYLYSEVAGGFTGVIIGLYTHGESCYNYSEFTNFECRYL